MLKFFSDVGIKNKFSFLKNLIFNLIFVSLVVMYLIDKECFLCYLCLKDFKVGLVF